ncbi:hypothetical protein FOMG_19275 [Fusarium oxysporum f. sp. melonis 26406]|uniref:Uncharacterized protein n=1 Tax=Fusarium oxysporum f. sp. melonis 26406 TaxID=1089452 RepID=W9YXT9_FUSOX|nr:hypothetical protein FOMG_19275 [Fusarium oxysporum f. sp. melonis 26406]
MTFPRCQQTIAALCSMICLAIGKMPLRSKCWCATSRSRWKGRTVNADN